MKLILMLMLYLVSVPVFSSTNDDRFNERYGLWFSFESTCSPCLHFAPILYEFASEHNLNLMAISKDSRPLRTWPGNWHIDKNATLYRLGIEEQGTPTLVLSDSQTGETTIVSLGFTTKEQLTQRLYQLTGINLGERE
ncbi:conjugal transfer protein TraF [Vibrio fluvialis]|uniref:conjugal transfer protein TraF n=1 Tax=Vibrio fluvialis TaxID=676 RepID=UPI001302159F|nr:conjugal transfer protein TraF [Vibrio fluvialis]